MTGDGRWSDTGFPMGPIILELPGSVSQARLDQIGTVVGLSAFEPAAVNVVRSNERANAAQESAPFLELPFVYANFAEAALGNANGQGAGQVIAGSTTRHPMPTTQPMAI